MKFPASRALYDYWSSLRQGRRAPERNDLDPAAMRHVLPQTFVLEVGPGPSEARRMPIRLSGTRLDAFFNRDLKGSAFVDLWGPKDRDLLHAIVADVLHEATPAVIGGSAGPADAPDVGFELLLLPLRHLGRTHARVLGSLAIASTPTWIGLQAAGPLAIGSWRMLTPLAAGGVDAANRSDQRAHLTVYEGGRPDRVRPVAEPQARVKPALSRWVNHR